MSVGWAASFGILANGFAAGDIADEFAYTCALYLFLFDALGRLGAWAMSFKRGAHSAVGVWPTRHSAGWRNLESSQAFMV